MAITIGELPGHARSGNFSSDGRHSITRKWRVVTDDGNAGPYSVYQYLSSSGIALGNSYDTGLENYPGIYLNKLNIEESEEDGMGWVATGEYSAWDPTVTGGMNPLGAPRQISMTNNTKQVPLYADLNGVLICNSAGQRFTQPVTRDANEPVLRVTRNEQSLDVSLLQTIDNTINLDAFLGFPAKTVRFVNHEISWNFHPGCGEFVTVQYQFAVKWETWVKRVIDQGTVYLKDGKQSPVLTADLSAVRSDPVPLDGTGKLLASGADPVFLDFDVYNAIDYAIFEF